MPAQFSRDDFDWGAATRLYWDLVLDPEKPLALQLDELKEDLIQAEYADGTVVDVGWYPDFQANGRFVTMVIRDGDWDNPVLRLESQSIPSLRDAVTAALSVARPRT